ncbi:methylated-DNA--[protein]-cysteine S-methyltransferase [Robertmurraya massiliosenegalensis]|uniref:methylated-DNA--[protein]-cysteine S-methyltransferase n=1 Tax=Robertmurraya TaxID=2837507 RepID=UPI0039A5F3C7
MSKQYQLDYLSPLGVVEIVGNEEGIYSIKFSEKDKAEQLLEDEPPNVLVDCRNQLDQYFNGRRKEFTIPYTLEGTNFQKTVWNALTKTPYGQTVSYKDIAALIGNENAVRAVGNANGKNKLSIVIPCHRIVGSSGKLTGYAGGLWRKEWLLKHESTFKK